MRLQSRQTALKGTLLQLPARWARRDPDCFRRYSMTAESSSSLQRGWPSLCLAASMRRCFGGRARGCVAHVITPLRRVVLRVRWRLNRACWRVTMHPSISLMDGVGRPSDPAGESGLEFGVQCLALPRVGCFVAILLGAPFNDHSCSLLTEARTTQDARTNTRLPRSNAAAIAPAPSPPTLTFHVHD